MTLSAKVTIALDGPFFTQDPAKTVRENIRDMLEALAEQGERDVKDHFPIGAPPDPHPGLGREGVVGRVESITGRRWQLHAVISQQAVYPWGARRGATIRSGKRQVANSAVAQYRGGKLERKLHMFSRTASRIRSLRAVTGANLTRGIE